LRRCRRRAVAAAVIASPTTTKCAMYTQSGGREAAVVKNKVESLGKSNLLLFDVRARVTYYEIHKQETRNDKLSTNAITLLSLSMQYMAN
jgi:hypothetical protein